VFVLGNLFEPSLTISSKARVYPCRAR